MMAQRAVQAKQPGRAVQLCRQVLASNPDSVPALHILAIALNEQDKGDEAIQMFERVIELSDNPAAPLCDMSQALMGAQRYDEAEHALRRAIESDPSFAFALGALAELYQLTGEHEKGRAVIEPAVRDHPDDPRIALAYGAMGVRIGQPRVVREHLERLLAGQKLNAPTRSAVLFRLAELCDHLGEYDVAFGYAEKGNALVARRHDPAAHSASIDRVIEAWSPGTFEALADSGNETQRPVFIVGMPRSGTSLVEQILSCHPGVHAAGELVEIPRIARAIRGPTPLPTPHLDKIDGLDAGALAQHAEQYAEHIEQLAPDAERVTDKLPDNFLHLGLIVRLFPNASIIHCQRDPADTCVSCYFKDFRGPYNWSYRQEWLGSFYNDYHRLMEHWRDTLDIPMHEVPYRTLVTEPEPVSRGIVESVGLEWDDACLRPHESDRVAGTLSTEQVRRPVYTSSVGRWRNYREHIAPLLEILGSDF